MNLQDYIDLEEALYEDCCLYIEEFSKTEHNKDVYMFVIYCNSEDFIYLELCISNIEKFNEIKNEFVREYNYTEKDINGTSGLKYRHFAFAPKNKSPKLQNVFDKYKDFIHSDECDDLFYEHSKKFYTSCVNTINKLNENFKMLNQTDDFIAFVALRDISELNSEELMRLTIPDVKFKSIFPDL